MERIMAEVEIETKELQEEDSDVEINELVLTFTNGVQKAVFTDETADQVEQRWKSELGRKDAPGRVMRFPPGAGQVLTRWVPRAVKDENGKETGQVEEIEVELPVEIARADLILGITVLPPPPDEDDDEDEGDDGDEQQGQAQQPTAEASKAKVTQMPRLPAGI
jgi:hypothetical protein